MSGTVPKTRKDSKPSQGGQKTPQKHELSPEEKLLEKQLEAQQDKVRRQAIEDAANGRNRNLLEHVLKDGPKDAHHLMDYSFRRAERVQKMLNATDELHKSMARCKHVQDKGSKLSKQEKVDEERDAKQELKERIDECVFLIEEMQDLNITAVAAKNVFVEEQMSSKQFRTSQKTLETQVAKQHKQSRKQQVKIVDDRRVWGGAYPGTRFVGRAEPWTKRETRSKTGLEDETMRDDFSEVIREDPELFTSALKPLIKETEGMISELYTALAEAKREESIMKRLTEPKLSVLQLERKTLTELRRYQRPPPILHKLVQAMLLLLGFDEFTTFEWDKCKTLLNPNGSHTEKGLNTRIEEFRVEELKESPFDEIAQRVQNIMSELDIKEVNKTSPAAVTLWIWVNGKLKELGNVIQPDQEGADVRRQIEILHAKSNPKGAQKMLASYRSSGQPK